MDIQLQIEDIIESKGSDFELSKRFDWSKTASSVLKLI